MGQFEYISVWEMRTSHLAMCVVPLNRCLRRRITFYFQRPECSTGHYHILVEGEAVGALLQVYQYEGNIMESY